MNRPEIILPLPAIRPFGSDMAKMKRLAPGIFRREDKAILVVAKAWNHPGKRERVFPAGTELEDAIRARKHLVKELKAPNAPEDFTRDSLTFHTYVELYRANAGEHAQTSVVSDLDRELGHLPIPLIEDAWEAFIGRQEHRNRMVWRRVAGELKLCDTGKPLSASTIKAYKRYFRAICGAAMLKTAPKAIRLSENDNPAAGIVVGKADNRRRPLLPKEREAIIETAEKYYPWFVPAIQFALTMPIRPGDQCSLRGDMIDEVHCQIPYLPQKTAKTGTWAYPLILPHLRTYIMGRVGDTECPFIFHSIDEAGRRVQLTYSRLSSAWVTILEKAGLSDIRFYDCRHDAVNYCLNAGFTARDVMAFAGWNSAEMVDGYDTRDRIRLAERAKEVLSMIDRPCPVQEIRYQGGKFGTTR